MELAKLTGDAFQNDEQGKEDFQFGRDQLYFALRTEKGDFAIGLNDVLSCLHVAEELNELPKIDQKWWHEVSLLYQTGKIE